MKAPTHTSGSEEEMEIKTWMGGITRLCGGTEDREREREIERESDTERYREIQRERGRERERERERESKRMLMFNALSGQGIQIKHQRYDVNPN